MGHYVSFVIHSWQEGDEGAMRWSVRGVNDPLPMSVPEGSFVIRTWVDDEQVVRGLIRHVQSGSVTFQSLYFRIAWIDRIDVLFRAQHQIF